MGRVGIPGAAQGLCDSRRCLKSSSAGSPCLETDATRMCALLVGLPDVTVVGVGDWPSWLRITIADRGSSSRAHDPAVERPDRGLASRARIERADRSDQQPRQTRETHRVRVPTLRPLPTPRLALRRPTQLVTPQPPHPTLKSEEPECRPQEFASPSSRLPAISGSPAVRSGGRGRRRRVR